MKVALGLRKGSWTEEEDVLLRNCVEEHGEGRWHLVPSRAGLNRCRKSCRLRWLNYLKPNIKRGEFEEDEVDMIIRLHKLLGNKWSMIAGRIPGRTANDIKNYFNTHLAKKIISKEEKSKQTRQKTLKVKVIKPHPRTFSRNSLWLSGKATLITCSALQLDNNNNLKDNHTSLPPETEFTWWEGLLGDTDNFDLSPANMIIEEETPVGELLGDTSKTVDEARFEDNKCDDILFDIDFWQLWDTMPQTVVAPSRIARKSGL